MSVDSRDWHNERFPAWHSTFAASADVVTSTVHARGKLDLFTIDLLTGAINVLTTAGLTEITLDMRDVESVDRAAAWCLAENSAGLASLHGHLTILHARRSVQNALGDLAIEHH